MQYRIAQKFILADPYSYFRKFDQIMGPNTPNFIHFHFLKFVKL